MKHRLLALLTTMVLVFAAAASYTQNTYSPVTLLSLEVSSLDHRYDKMFMKFNLPNIGGGTVTSAVLHMACSGINGTGATGVSLISEDVTWTSATPCSTMDAITFLGAATDTTTVTTMGDKTWDVTGTTNGIKQVYADGKTQVTVCVMGPDIPAAITNGVLEMGDDSSDSAEFISAYILITYTGGRPPRSHNAVIKGKGF